MNPVLRKDILSLLRLWRIAAVFLAFVALLGVLLMATWPQQGLVALATRGQDNLLLGLIVGQLLVLILAVPGVASVQLTEEKESNTLEMLYATRLSPLSIVLGKVGSAICFPMLLLVAGLPFVALLNFRGDVDTSALAQAYAVLVVTAIFLAMVSLAISAICKTSATSLVVAYMVVLTVCGAVLVPALIMLDVDLGVPEANQAMHYLRSISPIAAALSILRPTLNDFSGAQHGALPAWQVFLAFAGLAIVLSGAIIVAKLRRPPIDPDRAGGGDAVEARSIGRKMMFLIDDKKQRKPIGGLNPLIAKERRTNQLRSGKWMIRIFYASAVLALMLSLMALLGGTEHENIQVYVATVIASLQFAVVALVTPSLASPVISSEVEAGTFEMLRMTPLGGGKIFWGKFIPAFLPALLPAIAIIPAWIVVSYVNPEYLDYAIKLAPVTLMTILMCTTIAMAASSLSASSARATVSSYLIVAAIVIVPLIAWWLAGILLAPRIAAWIAMVSPMSIALDTRPAVQGQPLTRDLFNHHLFTIGGVCVLSLLIARIRLRQLMRQG